MRKFPSGHPTSGSRRRHSKSSNRQASDISWLLVPAFGLLLALEIILAFSTVRFWRIEADAVSDLKRLHTVNEILVEAHKASFELGRLSFQASMSPEVRNIEKYRDRLHVKSAAALDDSIAVQVIRNPLPEAIRELEKIRSEIARLGETESQRLASASREFESLLRVDQRTLGNLEGRFEDKQGKFTVVGNPSPAAALETLRDQSYQARRNDLGEELLGLQAAFDVRTLSLTSEIYRNSIVFFPLALASLAVLLIATIALGWYLYTHNLQSVAIHKTQIRKINEDLSRLAGQLSKTSNERDELARRLEPIKSPEVAPPARPVAPPPVSPTQPKPDEVPVIDPTYPGNLAEDYLTRLP